MGIRTPFLTQEETDVLDAAIAWVKAEDEARRLGKSKAPTATINELRVATRALINKEE